MRRLSGWDAVMLYSETPNVHQHTLKIAVVDTADFDGDPDIGAFREIFRGRLRALEPLRYQLVEIPLHFHHPMWRQDVDVDLDYHVRLVEVPDPGGRRELDGVIGEIASTPLDRSRPLWEMYFAVGLANRDVAVIGKVHHALADGVASANLMARGMEWPGSDQDEGELTDAGAAPSKTALIRAAARPSHGRALAGVRAAGCHDRHVPLDVQTQGAESAAQSDRVQCAGPAAPGLYRGRGGHRDLLRRPNRCWRRGEHHGGATSNS